MTSALIGKGILFSRGDGASPEQFVKVAEVVNVSPPALSRDSVQATHTDSPGGAHEYIPGLRDGGECTVTVNFLPANATQGNASGGLLHDYNNQDVARNYRVTFPNSPATTWTFAGFITGFQPVAPIDDRMTAEITFKVTGVPTIA